MFFEIWKKTKNTYSRTLIFISWVRWRNKSQSDSLVTRRISCQKLFFLNRFMYVEVSVSASDSFSWTVAALHQGAPGQMTWLEDPPLWLRPAYCFASVIVWTANKNVTISQISDRFICSILTLTRGVRDSGWPDLAWGFSDLEMTWLLYCAGAATVYEFACVCMYVCMTLCSLSFWWHGVPVGNDKTIRHSVTGAPTK